MKPKTLDADVYVSLNELNQLYAPAKHLYKKRPHTTASIAGQHLSIIRGRGADFDDVRPYQFGDDIRNLDWRVTARAGKPHTKVFKEERERPIVLMVDQSQHMFFGSTHSMKSVIASKAAALGAWYALNEGDRIGSFVYSDYQHHALRPKTGKSNLQHFLHTLIHFNHQLKAQYKTPKKPYSFNDALLDIQRITPQGTLMFIIADLRHFNQTSVKYLMRLKRRCDIIIIDIYDPLEYKLPSAGSYTISDGKHHLSMDTSTEVLRERYSKQTVQHQQFVKEQLSKMRISYTAVSTTVSVDQLSHTLSAVMRHKSSIRC